MEVRGPFGDPSDEFRQPGVSAQGFHRCVIARQLGLGQCRVDFVMANLVQQHRRPTFSTLQLGDQVMKALPGVGGNRPPAQGTYGRI